MENQEDIDKMQLDGFFYLYAPSDAKPNMLTRTINGLRGSDCYTVGQLRYLTDGFTFINPSRLSVLPNIGSHAFNIIKETCQNYLDQTTEVVAGKAGSQLEIEPVDLEVEPIDIKKGAGQWSTKVLGREKTEEKPKEQEEKKPANHRVRAAVARKAEFEMNRKNLGRGDSWDAGR